MRERVGLVAPFYVTLFEAQTLALPQPTAYAASVAARMCSAVVKPTDGSIYVGEYETRLQAPQAKRLVGFVDAAGFDGDAHRFKCEVAFRADVWNLDARAARDRAKDVLANLGDDAYARAVALALVAEVSLVVLDQPASRFLRNVRALAPRAAIIRTRVMAPSAQTLPAALEPVAT